PPPLTAGQAPPPPCPAAVTAEGRRAGPPPRPLPAHPCAEHTGGIGRLTALQGVVQGDRRAVSVKRLTAIVALAAAALAGCAGSEAAQPGIGETRFVPGDGRVQV